MNQCVIYVRVSTLEQLEKGDSRRMQAERGEAWAAGAGRTVAAVLEDEAASGKNMDDRPRAREAIRMACDLGCPLVVYSLSRLGRNLRELLAAMDDLQTCGGDLVSLTESIDTTTAAGKMMFRILAVLAEFERDLLMERTRAVLEAKRERGESIGVPPYGWLSIGGVLAECPVEKAAISEMVRLREAGCSHRGIAASLDDAGVATRAGGKWGESTIRKILGREGWHSCGVYKQTK